MPDCSPTDVELLAEVRRLVDVAAGVPPVQIRTGWGEGRAVVNRDRPALSLPVVGSPRWWAAPDPVRVAALLVLAESYLVVDPERQVRALLRSVSWDYCEELLRTRDLAERRKWAIHYALRRGDARRAIGLNEHHAGDQWWTEEPVTT